ncbi:unnamed protein product, partial [Didymodactylos carnosus]
MHCRINAKNQVTGSTALHAACSNGPTELVMYLIDHGPD